MKNYLRSYFYGENNRQKYKCLKGKNNRYIKMLEIKILLRSLRNIKIQY